MSFISYAIPSGDYYKMSRGKLQYNRTHIIANSHSISFVSTDGSVVAFWEIVSENYDSSQNVTVVSVKSQYGVSHTAYWWNEDGKTYLQWDGTNYVLN